MGRPFQYFNQMRDVSSGLVGFTVFRNTGDGSLPRIYPKPHPDPPVYSVKNECQVAPRLTG